jgi:serine phosphatase RsbU (regulator of sigma subunit)
MGKLRSALTALAPACAGPHELLERLDAFARRIEGADMATVAYAVADPAAGTVRYACAGHPPPLLVPPGGDARFLMAGRSMPLGSVQDGPRGEAVAALAPGALLLLYSDGLVERRRESVVQGLERLRAEAGARAGLDVEAFCDALVGALVDTEGQHDDVALLCLRAAPALAAQAGAGDARRPAVSPASASSSARSA